MSYGNRNERTGLAGGRFANHRFAGFERESGRTHRTCQAGKGAGAGETIQLPSKTEIENILKK